MNISGFVVYGLWSYKGHMRIVVLQQGGDRDGKDLDR